MRLWTALLALLVSQMTWAVSYSLDDLDILAKENSFEEFFQHAMDVRPTERGERWQGMVSKMADSLTSSILKQSEVTAKDYLKTEDLFNLPSLKTDDVFRLRRQEIALRYFKVCLKAQTPCWETVKKFWEKDPTDPELGLKLSEFVENSPASPLASWPFLEVALKSSLSEFYCKKPFVMKNLWDKLGIDYIRLGTEGDLLKKIDQTIHPDCIPSLNLEASRRLLSPIKNEDRELAYRILESQGKVDATTKDFFYTVYLLERPSQGELFNYSWSRLKELGTSEIRREKVLRKIKMSLQDLPDEIFSSLDESKRRAITTLFKENFPEYLDYYAHQCIKFFKGVGSFPDGNPTLHCQDLMNSDLAAKIFEPATIKSYQDAKKI